MLERAGTRGLNQFFRHVYSLVARLLRHLSLHDGTNASVWDILSRSESRAVRSKKGEIMFGMKICKSIFLALTAAIAMGAFAAGASAQEVDAKALLEHMSAEIAGLDSFIVHGDAYADARLGAGQIIEHSSQVTLRLRREPGSIRITNRSAENTEEIFFDEGSLSVYNTNDNFYAQTDIPKDLDSMLDFAVNEAGIEAPLLDFVSANVADDLLQNAEDVRYLDTSLIRDEIFHHLGIRTADVDIQIWVASEGRPIPGKLVISSKWEGGSPRFVAFFKWDTDPDFERDLFKFNPPHDAVEIEFLLAD